MKILVTGGAGFIASNLVDELVKLKHTVIVIDNLSAGNKENINKSAKFYKVDITDEKAVKAVFEKEKPEVVVHAAAQIQVVYSTKEPVKDAMINIIGGLNILNCCRDFKVNRFIYMCTGGALYGEPEYLPADEDHPIHPISPYGISKHSLELYTYAYHVNFGLDFVVLRFSNVYGIRDSVGSGRVIPLMVDNMLKGKSPTITGDGKQARDFIYVLDVVDGVIKAINVDTKKLKHRYFNIGSEYMVSINDVYSEIKKILKSDVKPIFIEARAGEVAQIYLKAERARKELGWKPRYSFEQGLKEYIEWFKKNAQ